MSKALRFVWLSLLTFICGVASAGTVAFDPTVDTGGGTSLTKSGVTFKITSGPSTLTPENVDGVACFHINGPSGKYEFTTDGTAGNITKVRLEYLPNKSPYIYCSSWSAQTETNVEEGWSEITNYSDPSKGLDRYPFSLFNNHIYLTKVIIEVQGDVESGEESGDETTISKLLSGKKDVDEANIKFTNAQVVYKDGGDYVVRENNKAITLSTALDFALGATLNGNVKMKVAYNNGFMKATDIEGVTSADLLVATGSSTGYLPISATLSTLSNYPGDLVNLENLEIYKDGSTYYFVTNYQNAQISNPADWTFNEYGKYNATALYVAPGVYNTVGVVKVVALNELPQAPAIYSAGGATSFVGSLEITIETDVADAKIYYTLDGTTPTEQSTEYTGPFTITKTTTVKAVVVKNGLVSEATSRTFQGPKTIADLYTDAQGQSNVNLYLNNAQVVYADGAGNYILREDGKALDVLNTSLALQQGQYVTGSVTLNVSYTYGILATSDAYGTTNADGLQMSGEASVEPIPVFCSDLAAVKEHPGDLVRIENKCFYGSFFYDYANSTYNYLYISNPVEFGMTAYTNYDLTVWYNANYYGYPKGKAVVAEPYLTSLDVPSITGEDKFTDETTVSITCTQTVAKIVYTLDGTDPTNTQSTVYDYTGPFTLNESATVWAVATYKAIKSEIAKKEFVKIDLSTEKTIAELAELKMNIDKATVKFNNAQVVYADGNNYIVREDGKAIDLLNTNLPLKQGQTLTGTLKVAVAYNNGILTTSDNEETNLDGITVSGEESAEPLPLECDRVFNVVKYPGDLVELKDAQVYYNSYEGSYYASERAYDDSDNYVGHTVYFANASEKGIVGYKQYNLVFWFNSTRETHAQTQLVKAERTASSLSEPSISGDEVFQGTQEVTIVSDGNEDIATIYYTLDGTDPKTSETAQKYTAPITLDATVTVKAYAEFKEIQSEVSTKEFTCVKPDDQKTLAELSALKINLNTIVVKLVDAKVVYGKDNNYILRDYDGDKPYALDVMSTSLPFTVGATVTGTVKLKVNYADYYKGGFLKTEDIEETNADGLTIVPGENTLPSPLDVQLIQVSEHPGDLLTVQEAKADVWTWSNPATYVFWTDTPEYVYLYPTNGADYNLESGSLYDVCLWYSGLTSAGAPGVDIIGMKENYDYAMTSAGWGTLILPFDCEKPEDLTIYECSSVNEAGVLALNETSCFMAHTPYLVKGTEGVSTTYNFAGYAEKYNAETDHTKGIMTGVYTEKEPPVDAYLLQNQPDEDGLAFYRFFSYQQGQGITVSANRCYLKSQGEAFKVIRLPGNETDGVANVNAQDTTIVDVFTTTGMKVKNQVKRADALNDLPAGVYIINNKKVIKK